ncbi:hypothetical protein [Streptomyces sp. NPDC002889]|uniref:hypothetical protein n=1 Tax=Streptomyces sp. NPDC002889 TaxID=3364669 RepID=UPI0036D0FC56
MDWLMAAWVGVAGGATMEAVDVIKSVKWHGKLPWNVEPDTKQQRRLDLRPGEEQLPAPGWRAHCIAAVLRLFVSGALIGALAATYPTSVNPLVAYMVGLGALSAVQQLATFVPLAVKGAGRAALGSVVEEAQQQQQALPQAQQPGPGQTNGALPGPQTGSHPDSSPQPETGVATPQGPPQAGGQV